jgi:N-acylneuraminate cytidylyltransferase
MLEAIIPARGGSVRVPGKNIRPFCGSSLLELKIRQLLAVPEIDRVTANSDSLEIMLVARKCGAHIVTREPRVVDSLAMGPVYVSMARQSQADVLLIANCTNPLIETDTIRRMIAEHRGGRYDSVNSAHRLQDFLWWRGQPLNYSPTEQPRSQDLEPAFALNFAVNLIRREGLIRGGSIVGQNPLLYELDEVQALDIDTELDFACAETMYGKRHVLQEAIR